MTPASADEPRFGTLIVGGGAAGVLVAIGLLMDDRCAEPVAIIEPDAQLARGAAYATGRAEHLLNVVASRMSAIAGQQDHFVRFLAQDAAIGEDGLRDSFARRRDYGRYLRHTLETLPAQRAPTHLRERAVDIERLDGGFRVHLADGGSALARHVVLAIGNASRPLPGYLQHPGMRLAEAWDYDAVQRIDPDDAVCILGSGLSMVDATLSLAAAGHRGPIHVLSRHGLMPLPHAPTGPQHGTSVDDLLPLGVRDRWRVLRSRIEAAVATGEPWQWSFDRLRHHGQALWQSLDDAQRRRFLRHAVRYWDIHRHRIAPEVAATLDALRTSGQLQSRAGRLQAITADPANGSHVHFRPRHGLREHMLRADWIINATGVETNIDLRPGTLLQALRGRGLVLPGPQGLGVASSDIGHVYNRSGRPDPGLYVLGALRIGDLWESIAIPELREQAQQIAADILTTGAQSRN
ncbi:FAD/NAD(P)-binding protein [Luteimonas sp. A482]